jgi:hypothetical protein
MLNRSYVYRSVAVTLLVATVLATSPVSASDITSPKAALGSVSAVGSVNVRGVRVAQEATVFSGDPLRVGEKGYASVLFTNGHKIELAEKTDVTLGRQGEAVEVQLKAGTVGFATFKAAPMNVSAGGFEIAAAQPSAGHVAIMPNDFVGVRVVNGSVTVRNPKTKESWVLTRGQERLLSLRTSSPTQPLAQIASNVPAPIPTVPPAPQGGSSSSGSGLSAWAWATILGGVAGAIAAVAVLTDRSDQSSTAAKRAAQQTVQSALATGQLAITASAQVASAANQANAAIAAAASVPPATRTALTVQAQTLLSQAQATSQQVTALQTQLQQLQTQLQGATGSAVTSIQQQIVTVTQNLNAEVANLNREIQQLNSLVQSAVGAGVPNVPNVTVQTVPPATVASPSAP